MTSKYFVALLVCAALSSAAPLHAQQPDSPSNDAAPIDDQAAGVLETFDWKLQPPIGYKARLKTWMRFRVTQIMRVPSKPELAPMRTESTSTQTTEMDYETISRDDRGATVSRLTFRKISTTETEKVNGKAVPKPDHNLSAELTKALIGAEFDIKQAPDGRVWSVQGLDSMRRRVRRVYSGSDPNMVALLMPLFDALYSEKTLRQSWDISVSRPPQPAKVGDSWPYKSLKEQLPMGIEIRGTRKLKALSEERAVLIDDARTLMNYTLNSDTKIVRKPLLNGFLIQGSGTLGGQTIVDRATGLPVEVSSAQRWLMKGNVPANRTHKIPALALQQWMQVESRQIFTPRS